MKYEKERKLKMLKYDEYVMNRNKNAIDLFEYEDVIENHDDKKSENLLTFSEVRV